MTVHDGTKLVLRFRFQFASMFSFVCNKFPDKNAFTAKGIWVAPRDSEQID